MSDRWSTNVETAAALAAMEDDFGRERPDPSDYADLEPGYRPGPPQPDPYIGTCVHCGERVTPRRGAFGFREGGACLEALPDGQRGPAHAACRDEHRASAS